MPPLSQNRNTGKRILHAGSSANSYSNVIGGTYKPGDQAAADNYKNQTSGKITMQHVGGYGGNGINIPPIGLHQIDMMQQYNNYPPVT